jgi:uncharacterized protein YbjT (DUF2867 family)
MTTLVTGATGIVGRGVVDQLLRAGETVRAVTRDPRAAGLPAEVEIHQGDLARPDTLSAALAGVDRLYLFPGAATAREIVARAEDAGVRRVVVLSSGAVTAGFDTDFHLPVERAVEASGVEWTHVRPGEFAHNKLWLWGPSIRAERVVRYADPDRFGVAPVHEADVAAVAVAALLDDGHAGAAYTFTGPEQLTLREQVGAIAAGIGEEVGFEEVTAAEARRILKAQGGWAAANADMLLGFEAYAETAEEEAWELPEFSPEELAELLKPMPEAVEQVTGRPARSFTEWARDHADDFR